MTARPTAAPPMTRNAKGALGYHEHRTMAQVMAAEVRAAGIARCIDNHVAGSWPCGCEKTEANTCKIGSGRTRCRRCHRAYQANWSRARYERERRSPLVSNGRN